eukprot:6216530-Alexandrium_andersonii.AAC.1
MEIFSPPRVSEAARARGLPVGPSEQVALDLQTGWDFRLPEHRREAWRRLRRWKPRLVLLEPRCD